LENTDRALVERLGRSKIFKDYETAFRNATGLPLALTPIQTWGLPHHEKRNENAFCSLMAGDSKSCAACLEVQQRLSERTGSEEPVTVTCFAGLCDTAVPLRVGDQLFGFLRTGQVMLREPTREQFDRTTRLLLQWGTKFDVKNLQEAYFANKVLDADRYQAMVRLLKVFADHLSLVSNQLLVQSETAEAPMIQRARQYIADNQGEDLSLEMVANAVNTSTFYFCKMFKKATGLTFTEYLGRVRVEKAKNLLLNPHLRISEVAFEVGFQSLSQFNRVFKKIAGRSPTEFRSKLGKTKAK
jgi:AraC-like DNA-binding protein/ligand-binding sensor protein